MVVITGLAAIGSILLQFMFAGRYLERVDNLVKRQEVLENDFKNLNSKVETFLLGVGKMNAFTRQFFKEIE